MRIQLILEDEKKIQSKKTVRREQDREGVWSRTEERHSDCGASNLKCVYHRALRPRQKGLKIVPTKCHVL